MKNYNNKMMTSEKEVKQEFFFPDINGQQISVKASNMAEAEKKAKEEINKLNKKEDK